MAKQTQLTQAEKELAFQLNLLENEIERLHQPATPIHALAHYSDLEKFEPCELEEALKGINVALYQHITSLNNRVDFIKAKLGGNND
ncbi:hypothetical protein ACU6T4_03475 [Avibacterium paragallinarum]|uniref:hypothetical protein n=1 Tax=Avibacterium paragallinarum TaxID=728 RepID=UPI00021AD00A|nr:hypothetical protein [Avibacterium paragallinarum]AZI13448.1 hypothetical protein EIA51_01620 [Avibacterium paragallinarum]QIR12910.1 hypothetical protein HBL79_12280 [Avibacterium paragallinarum]QJE10870.1 hypothetical protein HHJ62_11610 [Avibacterium paragallinarum]QJE13063.1 hypothetical protein HHJ61_11610 [Avibacterium paragallinarum]QJE15264.1 hypothetical protein HHJ60_11640 [Avibacterium paragallinarum]